MSIAGPARQLGEATGPQGGRLQGLPGKAKVEKYRGRGCAAVRPWSKRKPGPVASSPKAKAADVPHCLQTATRKLWFPAKRQILGTFGVPSNSKSLNTGWE